jgi:crotonobetainyl-CoA:carnitine CoA-transferase CaiB-like acyl-CoA transferase
VLDDLLVVDLTRALSGPHAAMMLADMGARVIKVEPPLGDESRTWGPPFVGPADDPVSTYFLSCNRNKESVTADLRSEDGQELLTRLVERADVLLENFRTGVLDRLGFSVERLHELNPRLVILSITGFGHDGPEASRPGYDQIAQGEAGLMSITGTPEEQYRVGVPIADLLAGMYGAYGVLAALHERHRTGRGRVVRASLLSSVVGVLAHQGTKWTVGHQVPTAMGNHHASIAPYGTYHAADGTIQIACGNDTQWQALAQLLKINDAQYATNRGRVENWDDLTAAVEASLSRGDAESWLTKLNEIGVPAGRVRSIDQVFDWEQVRSQGLLLDVDHPTLGTIQIPGPPLRLDDQTYAGSRETHLPPPRLGEHNRSVRAWLGMKQ